MHIYAPNPTPPAHLAVILADLAEKHITPTPLNVLCRASDLGLTDQEITALAEKMATVEGLGEIDTHGA